MRYLIATLLACAMLTGYCLADMHMEEAPMPDQAMAADAMAMDGMGMEEMAPDAMAAPAGPALADLLQTINAHDASVNCLALSPNAPVLATGGKDGSVNLWDTNTGSLILSVPACQVTINDLAFSPDGSFLVTASEDGYVKVWDAADPTQPPLQILAAHVGGPDSMGAVGRYNETIRSAHGTINRYAAERVPSVLSANTVVVSQDEATEEVRIYSGGDDGYVRCYNVTDNYRLEFEVYSNENGVNDVILSSDNAFLFAGGVDGFVKIYNAQTGAFIFEIQAFEQGEVRCLCLSNNQNCIATGGSNGEVRVWDAWTGSLVKKIRAHAGNVNFVTFTPDDMYGVSAGEDGKLKLWNHYAEKAGELQAHVLAVRGVVFGQADNGDSLIFTGGADFKVRVWHPNF